MTVGGGGDDWGVTVSDGANPDLLSQLAVFIEGFGSAGRVRRSRTSDYYRWKLLENPLGLGILAVATSEDGIVGSCTITRKRGIIRGNVTQVGEIGDTFTSPKWQRRGIFAALVKATCARAEATGLTLIYGTPNDQSLPGYEAKLDFRRKSALDLHLLVHPLPRLPSSILGIEARACLKQLRLSQKTPEQGALWRSTLTRVENLLISPSNLPHYARQLDELGRELAERSCFLLARQGEDLLFRLVNNPDGPGYRILLRLGPLNRLEGFLVCKLTVEHGMRCMWVAEVAATSSGYAIALERDAFRLAREQGCSLVATWKNCTVPWDTSVLPWIGRALKKVEVIVWRGGDGASVLSAACDWSFSILDSDNI